MEGEGVEALPVLLSLSPELWNRLSTWVRGTFF